MNKSNIEAGQPGQQNSNEQTAQNQQVSQPNANTNVGSSSFLEVVKEMDKYACQFWVDKSLWSVSKNGYSLCVKIEDDKATVEPWGYGSCQSLIAINPQELKECISLWWRNR